MVVGFWTHSLTRLLRRSNLSTSSTRNSMMTVSEYCGATCWSLEGAPMAEPDRRTPLLESYENAAVLVSGLPADQVALRTPCHNYDVAGLIDHIVEAAHRAAALGRGQAPPAGD